MSWLCTLNRETQSNPKTFRGLIHPHNILCTVNCLMHLHICNLWRTVFLVLCNCTYALLPYPQAIITAHVQVYKQNRMEHEPLYRSYCAANNTPRKTKSGTPTNQLMRTILRVLHLVSPNCLDSLQEDSCGREEVQSEMRWVLYSWMVCLQLFFRVYFVGETIDSKLTRIVTPHFALEFSNCGARWKMSLKRTLVFSFYIFDPLCLTRLPETLWRTSCPLPIQGRTSHPDTPQDSSMHQMLGRNALPLRWQHSLTVTSAYDREYEETAWRLPNRYYVITSTSSVISPCFILLSLLPAPGTLSGEQRGILLPRGHVVHVAWPVRGGVGV